jgi:hypothetical protein
MNDIKYKAPTKEKNTSTAVSYKTSDLYLSAYLKSNGIILQGIDKENSKVIFIFKNDGNIQDLINRYFNDGPVPVLQFKASLGVLRSIIFDRQGSLKASNR